MAALSGIKKRINAAKGISKITKAMEMVAASKMRKSQEVLLKARFYAFDALEILGNLTHFLQAQEKLKMLMKNDSDKTLAVVITSDKGLIGSFNNLILKEVEKFFVRYEREKVCFVTVGEKGKIFLEKMDIQPIAHYVNYGDILNFDEIMEISDFIMSGYKNGKWGKVIVFSMNFYSALKQGVAVRQILPFDFEHLRKVVEEIIPESGKYSDLKKEILFTRPQKHLEYIFEPNEKELLLDILPHLLKVQIYHIILEANASEHSARRFTMKNASDNAEELKETLLLQYNKLRQEIITKEINEITSTVAAMSENN